MVFRAMTRACSLSPCHFIIPVWSLKIQLKFRRQCQGLKAVRELEWNPDTLVGRGSSSVLCWHLILMACMKMLKHPISPMSQLKFSKHAVSSKASSQCWKRECEPCHLDATQLREEMWQMLWVSTVTWFILNVPREQMLSLWWAR